MSSSSMTRRDTKRSYSADEVSALRTYAEGHDRLGILLVFSGPQSKAWAPLFGLADEQEVSEADTDPTYRLNQVHRAAQPLIRGPAKPLSEPGLPRSPDAR